MEKVFGIVACSNAQKGENKAQNQKLIQFLENTGATVILSNCIYEKDGCFSGTGKERAEELMKLYRNPEVTDIYDISGGDLANEILDELDFSVIQNSKATFWGYSDLTTVINAIYSRTGRSSVLYQIRNVVKEEVQALQTNRFLGKEDLFHPSWHFVQGNEMEGVVVGGNIRCFLKLAGTKYFPNMQNKILLLEAMSGKVPQMTTYLSQLKSMGVFEEIRGILLGTFSQMQAEECQPDIISLLKSFVNKDIPIAKTEEIGHGIDSKAIKIGEYLHLCETLTESR